MWHNFRGVPSAQKGASVSKDEQWPLDLKVSSFGGQRSYAKWETERQREREIRLYIKFHCHWNCPARCGKEAGRKGLAQFPARKIETTTTTIWKRRRERDTRPWGTAATLVIPRLKASFNIYDLFRFNSTCKRGDAFTFSDVCALNRQTAPDVCSTRLETETSTTIQCPPPPIFSPFILFDFVTMIYIYIQQIWYSTTVDFLLIVVSYWFIFTYSGYYRLSWYSPFEFLSCNSHSQRLKSHLLSSDIFSRFPQLWYIEFSDNY